ncbi:hypothetical protein SAMN05660860_01561 [Geoalkalibacter ferrihydriticus]|uniref:Uncharacterized protein n=2 Tax=Geoalkalibacter ferrihydriticus TaxID=392333 RepID=A0A0C2HUF9_9BACT|nr:hypothetical protein [Geoalkalibacter ferrihydriticus]KIH76467.1 hypothetical protein GFER_09735 [Geoalkalibacter ferrihydriticus DSM 17813]SDL96777.1 hypothetical protein SAMN05660860_01561 [Geoalkalibacter ferrihydriticus]
MKCVVSLLIMMLVMPAGGCTLVQDSLPRWSQEAEPLLEPVASDAEDPSEVMDGPVSAKSVTASDILIYLAEFQKLDSAPQAEEYLSLTRLYEAHPGERERFQLATVLLIPGKGFSNAHKGRELLQGYLTESQKSEDLQALAKLLVAQVAEREKVETLLAREKETAATLARQLNELRNIETIMRQREVNGRPGL